MATTEEQVTSPVYGTLADEKKGLAKFWGGIWNFSRLFPVGAVSGAISLGAVLLAIIAFEGSLLPHDPIKFVGRDRLLPMGSTGAASGNFYLLGTDEIGRDMFSRLLKGAQLSVFFAIGVSIISIGIGGLIGLGSSYAGGRTDMMVQRVIDAVQTVPFLVLAIAIVSIGSPGIWPGFWAVAILGIPRPARVIRGSVLSVKQNVYVEAAKSLGASDVRVMFRHVLPNVTAPMIVLLSYLLAVAIIIEASLSFLGIGAQPPTPSWGAMLSGSGQVYFSTHPRLAILPGVSISIIVFATNMFGDSLRDALDPRLRGST